MNEALQIAHPLGLDGLWTCVPTKQREFEERLLEAVMRSLEADEEFRTSPRGGGIEDMERRKVARKKASDLETKMQARMVEYREYRLLNGPTVTNATKPKDWPVVSQRRALAQSQGSCE